jgi:uncharacterized RDD family membrane protein YckC
MTLHPKYNNFEKRLLAGFIDGFVFLPFALLITHLDFSIDQASFLVLIFAYIICWTLYLVIGHGKYGQTIGKYLMGIKLLRIDEKSTIGYKRAFYREAIWFAATTIGVLYFIAKVYNYQALDKELSESIFERKVRSPINIWFAVELATMFLTKKRRALQDTISGSIVVDLNEMGQEDLHKRQEELHAIVKNE